MSEFEKRWNVERTVERERQEKRKSEQR